MLIKQPVRQVKIYLRQLFQAAQFLIIYICPIRFGKTVYKKRPLPAPEEQEYPISAGFSCSGPGQPLFINAASQIGVPLTGFKLVHNGAKFIIGYTLFTGKAGEPGILEYPH